MSQTYILCLSVIISDPVRIRSERHLCSCHHLVGRSQVPAPPLVMVERMVETSALYWGDMLN